MTYFYESQMVISKIIVEKYPHVCECQLLKLRQVLKTYYLELLRALEGTLSRWCRLHLQSLTPTNPHWAGVVGYGPFSLCYPERRPVPQQWGHYKLMMMIQILHKYELI
jgi:hypothetical protein